MDIYTFPKNKIPKLARKQVFAILPLIAIILVGSLSILNHVEDNEILEDPMLLVIMAFVTLFILIGGFFATVKTISKILLDTKFIVNTDSIKKQIPNGKDIEVFFREIRSSQNTKKGFIIKAPNDQLLIPTQLHNFKELETLIKSKTYTAIQYTDTKFKMNETVMKYIVGISIMFMLVSFFIIDIKEIKLIVGLPLVLGLLYAIFDGYKNQNTSYLSKGAIGKLLIYTLLFFAYIIYIAIYT